MINDEPSVAEMAKLWQVCMDFIAKQEIHCAETIYQSDRVIENSYEFMEQVADVVGYVEYDEDEE